MDDVGVDLRTRGGGGALASSRSLKCLMALVAMEEGNIIYLFSCRGFRFRPSRILDALDTSNIPSRLLKQSVFMRC